MLQTALKSLASAPLSRVLASGGGSRLISTAKPTAVQSETSKKEGPEEGCQVVLDAAELQAEMLDVEMDRDEGPEFAVYEGLPQPAEPREQMEPLARPCDLEFEYDRDDPEAAEVDQEEMSTKRPQYRSDEETHGVGAGVRPHYVKGRDTGPKFEDTS